ncbi:hypothetical protein AMECASPLE_023365 [Ameca splendens]|uniref:Uncharacterized protein n=1 Tax=Ameca splendens TaxID=208324 RepID=A0ABV0YF70_9TELE
MLFRIVTKPDMKTIHPSSIPASSIQGHWGAGAYLQRSTGEKRGTPWTGRQSIAGQHKDTQDKQLCTHPFIPKGNLERPITLTAMFLYCGRKLEEAGVPRENPRVHGEKMQTICKSPGWESHPGPSLCKATVQPTGPL